MEPELNTIEERDKCTTTVPPVTKLQSKSISENLVISSYPIMDYLVQLNIYSLVDVITIKRHSHV